MKPDTNTPDLLIYRPTAPRLSTLREVTTSNLKCRRLRAEVRADKTNGFTDSRRLMFTGRQASAKTEYEERARPRSRIVDAFHRDHFISSRISTSSVLWYHLGPGLAILEAERQAMRDENIMLPDRGNDARNCGEGGI